MEDSTETWTEIDINGDSKTSDLNKNDPEDDEQPTTCFNCCCCHCIKQDEVYKARKDLFGIIVDWLIDAGVGTVHILKGNLIAGILTFFIVLQAGAIITFTNLSSQLSKSKSHTTSWLRSEIWKSNKLYGVLMYIPSFYPICTAKLRLTCAKKLKTCQDETQRKVLKESLEAVKDKALWDSCCETFFEAFPQAVLQIVLLFMHFMHPEKTNIVYSDFFPILTIFTALYGITGSPISVIEFREKGKSWKTGQTVTAYSSNSLRVFSCALFIISILSFARSSSTLITIGWITLSALIIFCLLGGPFIIKHEIDVAFPTWTKLTMKAVSALSLLTSLFGFYLWVLSEVLPYGWLHPRIIIVVVCYSILVFFTCCGLLMYSSTLELYQSTAADVIVQTYIVLKTVVRSCFTCRKTQEETNEKNNDIRIHEMG